jgi:hypothetical protein
MKLIDTINGRKQLYEDRKTAIQGVSAWCRMSLKHSIPNQGVAGSSPAGRTKFGFAISLQSIWPWSGLRNGIDEG